MDKRYQLIIKNNKIYKAIELNSTIKALRIGTDRSCDIRLNREQLLEDLEFYLENKNSTWIVSLDKQLYYLTDNVTNFATKNLAHGDELEFIHQQSKQEILTICFMYDFDYETKNYDRVLDLKNIDRLEIGGNKECGLLIKDELIGEDYFTLFMKEDKWFVVENQTKYGVYVNDNRVQDTIGINDYDFISINQFSFYFRGDKLYASKSNNIEVRTSGFSDIINSQSHL